MKKMWKLGNALILIIPLLGGCYGEQQQNENLESEKIKVMYHDEPSFYNDYGNLFKMKNPKIEFDVISMNNVLANREQNGAWDDHAELKKLIETYKPDVLLLNENLFEDYARQERLYDIETMIAKDKFDIDAISPGLIEMIRGKGDGKLYGLAPSFYADVLYFNRDLFKQHHIDMPTNKMTWKQLFELSRRFINTGTGEKKIVGLYQDYGVEQMLQEIASSSGLRLLDAKADRLLINSDGWKEAIKLVTNAVRDKFIYLQASNQNSEEMAETFYRGQATMTINGPWLAKELKARALFDSASKSFEWDIATMPVDPSSPDESANVHVSEIYAVSEDSPNKQAAWEFVKFVNSADMVSAASRTANGKLPARSGVLKDIEGKSTEPFYLLTPKTTPSFEESLGSTAASKEFNQLFQPVLSEELQAIIDDKQTVEDAIAVLEVKGQEALQKAKSKKAEK
ncbi:multiple sugar transport system substrate-binding protein [Paenibacillus sp. cl6col]|uniref:ABC transporter substrate-binding protein n=1 Tax=Paenibacillus sp. cl6col TaxID=1761878 RepID=UPI00087FFAA9|nr:extracellular solute-binding protein [Paenibacillus sp. cl6col]SDG40646.1 multiple sugar transport system substrate-binding protein [Paenibacillus sp. cl6col]